MKKVIQEPNKGIIEYYCDGCNKLMFVEGDSEKTSNLPIEPTMAINANFGARSSNLGLYFQKDYCNECADIILNMLKICFIIEREQDE